LRISVIADCRLGVVIDDCARKIANLQSANRQSSIRNPQFLWLLLLLEAPTESQMEIDPLHALLGLHPHKSGARRVQRELTL